MRGLSSDEQNTTLLNNQRTSCSSFGQMSSGQVMLTYGADWVDNEPWPTKSNLKNTVTIIIIF